MFGTLIGAYSGSGLLVGFPAVEAALSFMLPALFMSFLLASFQRKQSLSVTAALAGALGGIILFSIPAAILAGIVCGCLAALIQASIQGCPMNNNVLIIGIVVGRVNYLFRYLPAAPARRKRAPDASRSAQRAARYHRHRFYLRPADRLQRAGNPQRFQTAAAYVGWIHGAGTGVLEDAQHYYAHAAERVGLWNSMENHHFYTFKVSILVNN